MRHERSGGLSENGAGTGGAAGAPAEGGREPREVGESGGVGGVRNDSDTRDSRESGTGSPAAHPAASAPPADGKRALRRTLLDARARLTPEETGAAARALTRHALELPELTGAPTVAAYVSVGREPGTRALLDALRTRGVRVLLPVLLPDDDLDWGEYEGADRLVRAGRGLLEPDGPRLGPGAVREAEAVLLPGLAVDGRGMRLGRGGGSYDRVLERLAAVPVPPCLVVLLYAHEVVAQVPEEAHDRPVHAVVTPDGVRRFTRA
ncbi:5-formyltetrahydrofolate cyclo-ligase [Streptomyces sp. SID5473]|uniref:5-formyltetrahydrofolate cyclo-ligase n=1 Tax=Streptomyces tsukubensis (strain DSM 42081 / NBRC 108919 / NRRL 18488 / 9993) TaxID=1114943 RepID=A0A7G3UH78_STRT9|nr:5-formyltetrahydrofolate cyclo-ligase [Streptomyces tsukubensis]MYS68375.1 5-formyltetrahydrofolate cyclo-ligase [Streptomyces sp. SID5473]QKM69358.1 5-formyltetrahydrofolate cyclo-ligase [Streptomyces tsukubensis NRRL18488]TAI42708.1 5-formyltetrahydrofolate cyclo-ligase [Streptomyces tsukubensis]